MVANVCASPSRGLTFFSPGRSLGCSGPLLRPVRNRLPNLGGIDLSPLVVLLLIQAAMLLVNAIQGYLIRGGLYF